AKKLFPELTKRQAVEKLWKAILSTSRVTDDPVQSWKDANLYPGVSASVSAIINFYGCVSVIPEDAFPSTVNHLKEDSPEGMVMGGVDLSRRPDLCRRLSVECNIRPDTPLPPVLILHGTKDRTVNTKLSVMLYKHLIKCSKEAYLVLLRGADHGGPEFWTPEALDRIDGFLKKSFTAQSA
ncbi:MAG: aminopeptidase, partial [Clostridia bacterium]|nr:aminopeptidase [Clostridia bacterium]